MIMILILIVNLMKKYRIILDWNWMYSAEYYWTYWWEWEIEAWISGSKEEIENKLNKIICEQEKERKDREIIEIYPYENKICLNDWMKKADCSCQGDTCLNDKHQKKGWWKFLNTLKRFF